MSTTPTTDLNSLAMALYVSSMEHGGNGDLQLDFGGLSETEQDYWLTLADQARDHLLVEWRHDLNVGTALRAQMKHIEGHLQAAGPRH